MRFVQQVRALVWKNLLTIVRRHPGGFLVKFYGIPLVLFTLLSLLPTWILGNSGSVTIPTEQPATISSLASAVTGMVVIVQPPNAGIDITAVVHRATSTIDKSRLVFLDHGIRLDDVCDPKDNGCFAVIEFTDSPETNSNALQTGTWSYTIRTNEDIMAGHSGSGERIYMPIQLAVNGAIGNTTSIPRLFAFSDDRSPVPSEHLARYRSLDIMMRVYLFILFSCHLYTVYQLTSWITTDRDSGISALVDAMGGRWVALARTCSWVLILDIVCLPLFIIFGILYSRLLFPTTSDVGVMIGWQILLGLAINSAAAFGAAFFSHSRISAISVAGVLLSMAIAGQFYHTRLDAQLDINTLRGLYWVFPSSSYTLFMFAMLQWTEAGLKANIYEIPPKLGSNNPDLFIFHQATLLAALAVQIVMYFALALAVEWWMHGISFKARQFAASAPLSPGNDGGGGPSILVSNLQKKFHSNIFTRILSCGTKKAKAAVNDISIEVHKSQIMCLVGQNGSGKTTTLHMMAGFTPLDAGQVLFDALPSQIGVCPQKNILWEELTVRDHIVVWSGIKASHETDDQIDQLIADCDLAEKRYSLAKTLSGGQKRKLQLACMLIGGSTICLIDECTSGLDPLSRQAVWDLLLRSRKGRSIILTTHFLDEIDVLADHIAVLSHGKVICQGSLAELNTTYGGGYKVLVDSNPPNKSLAVGTVLQPRLLRDKLVYEVPDSAAASQLSETLANAGVNDFVIAGPQFEDVFLRLGLESSDQSDKGPSSPTVDTVTGTNTVMTTGRKTSFATQVHLLLGKRFKVLPRIWWPYMFILVITLGANMGIYSVLSRFKTLDCSKFVPVVPIPSSRSFFSPDPSCSTYNTCNQLIVSPKSATHTLADLNSKEFELFQSLTPDMISTYVQSFDDESQWLNYIGANPEYNRGGIYLGNDTNAPIIAYSSQDLGIGPTLFTIWSEMKSKTQINTKFGRIPYIEKRTTESSWILIIFFTIVQSIYTSLLVIYPAMERHSRIKAFQYANGVRPAPLTAAYILFDLIWIIVVSVVTAVVISFVSGWIGNPWVMIVVLSLYGICAAIISQMISCATDAPLKSFLLSFACNLTMYAVAAGSYLAPLTSSDAKIRGITFGLGLILPIGNVFRAFIIGLNAGGQSCENGATKPGTRMDMYAGPIVYLIIQILVLLPVTLWMEGGLSIAVLWPISKKLYTSSSKTRPSNDTAKEDIELETLRVEASTTDPLRVMHATKRFGRNVAVGNVTFGVRHGEVLALLGPNGAGKSTLVNMIQSELSSDSGNILLCGKDVRNPSAQQYLGVCPQHDALDLLSTQQHLEFFAHIKGVGHTRTNVDCIMKKLDLTPHANTSASKLSGGNKRKLSLAIALMGMPAIVVLDEPTTAMDAMAKRSFWQIVESLAPDHSILLTTHSMEEADRLATRTAIIASRILAIGSTAHLRNTYGGGYSVSLSLRSAPNSTSEEMWNVFSFFQTNLPCNVALERDMLRGQIRLIISPNMTTSVDVSTLTGDEQFVRQSGVIQVWNLLEEKKDFLGIAFYSIGGTTLGNAFMNVVRANHISEQGSKTEGRTFWQIIRGLL